MKISFVGLIESNADVPRRSLAFFWASQVASGKNPPTNAGDVRLSILVGCGP